MGPEEGYVQEMGDLGLRAQGYKLYDYSTILTIRKEVLKK